MRFVLFEQCCDASSGVRVGVLLQQEKMVVDLTAALSLKGLGNVTSMKKFLEMGTQARAVADEAILCPHFKTPLCSVTLKAPITDPEKIICIGMNYVDHCEEQGVPIPKEPMMFNKYASSIVGPGDNIVLSPEVEFLDYEVELVIVIGKAGRRIPAHRAHEHIAGFTVCHDVSARHWQTKKNGGQFMVGKTFDTFCPLGPSIVTPDEFGDETNKSLRCILNGKVVQDSNTNKMVFKPAELVEWASKFMTLMPGDVISTGTPPGVGVCRKPPVKMKPGDVVTVEVEGIGAVTNTVVAETLPATCPPRSRL